MTNRELLAEVRRFFPHARMNVVRYCVPMFNVRRSGLLVWSDASGMWTAQVIRRGKRDFFGRWSREASSPAEALRALGFAERSPGAFCNKNRHRAEYIRQFDFVVTDFPLQCTQRPRKGVRLGKRKRRGAA